MRSDAADAAIDRERHLDQFVERRLVLVHAERTEILRTVDRLQRGPALEYAAAPGTKHVPRHVEEAQPCRMDEPCDRGFLVQRMPGGEGEHVDAVEVAVRSGLDFLLQRGGDVGIRSLA